MFMFANSEGPDPSPLSAHSRIHIFEWRRPFIVAPYGLYLCYPVVLILQNLDVLDLLISGGQSSKSQFRHINYKRESHREHDCT